MILGGGQNMRDTPRRICEITLDWNSKDVVLMGQLFTESPCRFG